MPHRFNEFGQPVGLPVESWVAPPAPPRATLRGRLASVEPLDPARHAQSLHAANTLNDGSMWTYLPYGPFATFDEYRAWAEDAAVQSDTHFYAICDVASSEAIGVASYLRIAPAQGCIEVGHLAFSRKLQQTPIATEAMFLMMRNVLELGYRRYEWKCDSYNFPSRAAAQRLGFTYEGEFRQAVVVKGRNRDTTWFSITDAEWPALKAAFEQWLAPENFGPGGEQRVSLSSLTRPLLKAVDPVQPVTAP